MSFTLKNYQRRVLSSLNDFLRECHFSNPAMAYQKIAHHKDENGQPENPYATKDYRELAGLEYCPHVCLRVPTGGGKTYLAALSLRHAADFMETETPTVLWFVPSDAIRRQTVDMLNDPTHPCRDALNESFGMMTQVCDIADFVNLRPQDFTDRVSIIVSTAQMFRVSETAKTPQGKMSKATRKIYAPQEELEPHFTKFLPLDPPPQLERDKEGQILFSFANLLFLLRPVVILDEAHGFVSDLSKTVLQRINPACVIEWTATPREKPDGAPLHNVLVSVGAEELRDEEMIKLPVHVTGHSDWEKAVNGAVDECKRLTQLAIESRDPVRPIVLYKAQHKNAEVPVGRLKQHLVEVEGVPIEAIAIATGDTKELSSIDLLAADCRIQHIITVEALREGWDCSFAYVLCPVDNMHSATAVEQLLGRVLRMPFAKRRKDEALNRAYAHITADSFIDAIKSLRDKMATGLGFEEEEIRWAVQTNLLSIADELTMWEKSSVFRLEAMPDFSTLPDAEREVAENAIKIIPPEAGTKEDTGGVNIVITKPISPSAQKAIVSAVFADVRDAEKLNLMQVVKDLTARQSPAEKGVAFAALTQLTFILPETEESVVVNAGSLHEAAEWNDLGDDYLIQDFSIKEDARTFQIDIKDRKVVHERTAATYQIPFADDKGFGMNVDVLTAWLEKEIRESDGRYFPDTLREFVSKNIQALTKKETTIAQLVRAKYILADYLKQWLSEHANRVMKKTRQRMLFDNENLCCEIEFKFEPRAYHPGEQPYTGNHQFKKHYYDVMGKMDSDEEENCAIALDGMTEIRHWIRNVPRKPNSFSLPRSWNNSFYPDFVAEMSNGKILVVEYKGADRWADSKLDRQIGELWERRSNGRNFFLMVSKKSGKPSIEAQLKNKVNDIFKNAVT